jgi:DtxR family Mn-dependent transcriptional regulator/ferrous iron transport protein A
MSDKLSITALKPGDKVKVFALNAINKQYFRKLAVFGMLPGTEVEVLQVKPVYVLRIGHTDLAIDREIAQSITFIR